MKYRLSPPLVTIQLHSQSPNNGILKNNCYNTPTSTSQYFLVLGPPEARKPQYEKIFTSRIDNTRKYSHLELTIFTAHKANTRKYSLLEVIENVTRVGIYDEISPEPSGNPSGSDLGISLGLRRYFIVYPSPRHNTVTLYHF